MKLGCVVMAAGNARRFGDNKLAALFQGKSLIRRTLEAVPGDVFDRVVVVTQYPKVAELAEEFCFTAVHNEHPDYGISHTIELGLMELNNYDGALFLVSDQPLLRRESVAQEAAFYRAHPDRIVGLGHNGVRGKVNVSITDEEAEKLRRSADTLKQVISSLDI